MTNKKMTLQPDKLRNAKVRLTTRVLTKIDETNKEDYYKTEYRDVVREEASIWRAVNGSTKIY